MKLEVPSSGPEVAAPVGTRRASLRVAVIADAWCSDDDRFVSGIETHTLVTVRALRRAGHQVTLFCGTDDGCVPRRLPCDVGFVPIVDSCPDPASHTHGGTDARRRWTERLEAGFRTVLEAVDRPDRFDVIHDTSTHYLPVIYDGHLTVPMIHVLHGAPVDELLTAHRTRLDARPRRPLGDVLAMSAPLAASWWRIATTIVPPGVQLDRWGPGAADAVVLDRCVWAGCIVEENTPHLAIDAARATRRPIVLAGPVHDDRYFDREIRPRLGADVCWLGELSQPRLAELFATSSVGLVTTGVRQSFTMVPGQMLASGLPIAGSSDGAPGLGVDASVACLVETDDVGELAGAIDTAALLDREACRDHARRHLSDVAMIDRYVRHYRIAIDRSTP